MKAQVFTSDGVAGKEIELPDLFGKKKNEHLVYEAVKCYLSNQRQGTSNAKSRSEVSGGGEKPYKQKGTGRARAGSNTSSVWVRGAKAHGPKPRSYRTQFNRKARRLALVMALSEKAELGSVKVLESIRVEAKTKSMAAVIKNMGIYNEKSILILDKSDRNLLLAGRNLKQFSIKTLDEINIYDVINNSYVILTEESLKQLSERVKK